MNVSGRGKVLDYKIVEGAENMRLEDIVRLLRMTYWAEKRPTEQIGKSVRNSSCYGVCPCHLALLSCELVDDLQFWDTLHIETEDVVVEAQVDLPVALAHTGVDNLRGRESGLDGCFDLAAAHTVGTQSRFTDDAQDLGVGIGLYGIVHHEALMLAGLLVDGAQRLAQYLAIVIVERRLDLLKPLYRKFSFSHRYLLKMVSLSF